MLLISMLITKRFALNLVPCAFYPLPFAFYLLPFTFCLLPFPFSLVPIAYCLVPVAYCLVPVACCLLLCAYCLLPCACCLVPCACCLLPSSHYSSNSIRTAPPSDNPILMPNSRYFMSSKFTNPSIFIIFKIFSIP